jgi:hypothetical protein
MSVRSVLAWLGELGVEVVDDVEENLISEKIDDIATLKELGDEELKLLGFTNSGRASLAPQRQSFNWMEVEETANCSSNMEQALILNISLINFNMGLYLRLGRYAV